MLIPGDFYPVFCEKYKQPSRVVKLSGEQERTKKSDNYYT
ncbi:hypothetical protein TREPR_1870 [Treponema primitia ZAS-2]|uniref:Uncharacterized protein n=1 Tax=Treponema primitia (strain ATCC BAA-887 / DSM 12427 / ZAS-2) TaxID=545694 RepID=F5YL59_TREPZ|nr:hypothetical protein TREPR_1870 [Treponema primitia ZAS-2]